MVLSITIYHVNAHEFRSFDVPFRVAEPGDVVVVNPAVFLALVGCPVATGTS